ncbi:MAG: SMC-Scp complex subunit ScpB [Hyphomicrobiaceae bacterium]
MMIDGDPAEEQPMDDGATEPAGETAAESGPSLVTIHPSAENREKLRIIEALLFAAAEPLDLKTIGEHLEEDVDVEKLLAELQANYAGRGVNLKCVGGRWAFRTAEDLSYLLEKHTVTQRRLSRAALETLAIIAYHQPATRAEIEEIRGVTTSKGTLDVLLETGWIKLRGRRRSPGRPVTYGTSTAFLEHFGFESLGDLPGLSDLKGAGLLSSNMPSNFVMPVPTDLPDLTEEEDPLEDEDEDDNLDLFEDADSDDEMDNAPADR